MADLTESQQAQVKAIRSSGGKPEAVKCVHCGKLLVKDSSRDDEQGDYCSHLHETYTSADLKAHRASLSADVVPAGWIKVAALHKLLVKLDIPVSRMVNAFGRDRGLSAPLHPKFAPLYVGNARWLDPWCASKEGLDFLRNLGTVHPDPIRKAATPISDAEQSLADAMNALFSEPAEVAITAA
jgi:hypothetical protein